jgi:hypothetical protein
MRARLDRLQPAIARIQSRSSIAFRASIGCRQRRAACVLAGKGRIGGDPRLLLLHIRGDHSGVTPLSSSSSSRSRVLPSYMTRSLCRNWFIYLCAIHPPETFSTIQGFLSPGHPSARRHAGKLGGPSPPQLPSISASTGMPGFRLK